jgi:CspA family cold shock protein
MCGAPFDLLSVRDRCPEEVNAMEGTVKWYNDFKSYGFITTEDGDIFVHRNALPAGTILHEGDKVEFEIEQTDKGPQAINVKKL